jgi:hypothetical protein
MAAPSRSSRVSLPEKTRTLRTSERLSPDVAMPWVPSPRPVAKKVRTPSPPRRPVQAPQRRQTRRAPTAPGRSPWWYALGGAAVAGLIVAAVLFFVLRDDGGGGAKRTNTPNLSAQLDLGKTKAPWEPDVARLADRLLPLGLSQLEVEQLAFHIHQHLDIFVNGKRVAVPASIGINQGAGWLTEQHTHDGSGILHVESAEKRDYVLGGIFGEWGVWLDSKCIGAYCNGLKWYVNGKQQTGDPWGLVLKDHQEIAIVVGSPPEKIPSTYPWAKAGV